MPHYITYPSVKDTPQRKQRKAKRRSTFWHNKQQAAVERKERRKARFADSE